MQGQVKDNFFGPMVNIIQGGGKMVRKMEVGIGDLQKDRATWGNGKMDK
jgi:hypothetical protein